MIPTRSPRGEVGLDGSFVFPVWVRLCCVVGFPFPTARCCGAGVGLLIPRRCFAETLAGPFNNWRVVGSPPSAAFSLRVSF